LKGSADFLIDEQAHIFSLNQPNAAARLAEEG
jgi:hypothetical protein